VAHSLSAKKRIRQNLKARARNRARKQQVKTAVKTFNSTIGKADEGKAIEVLRAAIKKIDQIAAKGTLHRNAAARKKSQLQRKFNAALAKAKAS